MLCLRIKYLSQCMNEICSCTPVPNANTDGPIYTVYIEGDQLFETMLTAIACAQQTVWMETYIFADDEVGALFAHALSERAKAGVQVRLLVDAVGSLFQFNRLLGTELEQAGVYVRHFHRWHWRNPWNYNRRDHRKLLVVDGKIAFLGGFNIHKQSSKRYFGVTRWRDTHVAFQGKLAEQAAELFDAFWGGEKHYLVKGDKQEGDMLVPNQSRVCRQRLACIYNDALGSAKQQILLTTPYFVPDHRTQKTLISAARRGVKVSVLVPRNSDVRLTRWAAKAVYAYLMDAGVHIFEYLPRMLHAKVIIVDRKWVSLGTANLDYRSLFQNYELNLISNNPELCHCLQTQFEVDLAEATLVCATRWQKRTWTNKLAEFLGWSVRRWL